MPPIVVRRDAALGLTALAPLVWLPGGLVAFVLPKLLVTALAALVAALAPPAGRLPRGLVLVAVLWAAVLALAATLGETPLVSLLGRWPRFEGLPVLGLYAAACWTGARVVAPGEDGARRLRASIGASGLVLAAFTLLDLVGVSPLPETAGSRSGSLLGNATDQGAVAMAVALLVARPALERRSGLDVAALVAALATVAASGSRTALVLTAVGLLLSTRRPLLGLCGVAGLAAAALALPATRDRLLDGASGSGRLEQWRLTLDLVAEHPWLGIGPNRYVDAVGRYETPAFVRFTGPEVPADSPHSVVLQVLVGGGLVLLAVTLVAVVLAARRALTAVREHPERGPALLAVTASALLLTVNFTAAGPTCLAAFLLGTVLVVPRSPAGPDHQPDGAGEADRPSRSETVVGVLAGTAALLLVASCVAEVRLGQGVEAARSRSGTEAAESFGSARTWRPWDPDVGMLAGRALAEEASLGGDDAVPAAQEAEQQLGWSLDHTVDNAPSLVALGVARLRLGDLAGALAVLDAAVAAAPMRPDGYVQRAIARYGLDDRAGALADLDRAAEIAPGSPVVQRLREQVR